MASRNFFARLATIFKSDAPWDVTIEKFSPDSEPILSSGAMTRQSGQEHASYATDNWSRRTYPFSMRNNRWVQIENPLMYQPARFG